MGQKVNPNGLRIGINKNWNSRWIAKDNRQTAQWLVEDDKIRTHISKVCKASQVANIEIERQQNRIDIFIHCSQPGIVLGKEMANLKILKKQINYIVGRKTKVNINVLPVEKPTFSARIIAREIADAIENRVSFRNAQKLAIKKVLASGAKGIKTNVSGRLGGVEMAREEGYSEGIVPLTTLRADIDYALEEALTTYGLIGVKVWINRGEVFKKNFNTPNKNIRKPNDRKPNDRKDFANNSSRASNKNLKDESTKREHQNLKVVDSKDKQETSIIMVSTKPECADILLNDQSKNVLFCKIAPANAVKRVLLYATAPVQMVIGEFDLEKIEMLEADKAWKKYGSKSCMSKKQFDEHFQDSENVYAMISKESFKYSKRKSLESFNMSKGPSGFQYLK